MDKLSHKRCVPCEGNAEPLNAESVRKLLKQIHPNWRLANSNDKISREFPFKTYGKTMMFVNAVAWIALQELHHPDLEVSYNRCVVTYSTHAINGLSENDFICAAKVDQLQPG